MNQKVKQVKDGVWGFLNTKAGIGILCALLAGGGINYLPSLIGAVNMKVAGQEVGIQETPMACTRAMQDMREAEVALRVTVEEQGKRLDRIEAKLDRVNERLSYGRHSQLMVADKPPIQWKWSEIEHGWEIEKPHVK